MLKKTPLTKGRISAQYHCLWVAALLLSFQPVFGQSEHWRLWMGVYQYQQKSYASALAYFNASGKTPAAFYNAGNAAFQLEQYENAADKWVTAAEFWKNQPQSADAWYNAGNAFLAAGQFETAIEAYQKSLRLQPNRPDAKKNLRIAQLLAPPPPAVTPPPPPPPPPPPARNQYLDQGRGIRETAPLPLSPEAARKLLETAIAPVENESARQYRRLAPSNKAAKGEKAW